MKQVYIFILLFASLFGYSQSLPIDFETDITTENFIDFSGGMATVIDNPQMNGINQSSKVAQIIRDGGDIWAGSKIELSDNLDFSTMNSLSMKVFTTAPVGTTVKFKLEGGAETERDVFTTVSGEWEILTWDFTGASAEMNSVVFMFDFGNTGDGSETSTFLFDDVEQLFGGLQLDLPVNFEDIDVNYTVIDFGGNASQILTDPTDMNNNVIQTIKTNQAETWAGTTIGTAGGFKTNIPFNSEQSKMTVRVWSPDAGIPVRLKVEDSNDVTRTCETEAVTTVSGEWETLVFDFNNEAPGTTSLNNGLAMGWTYNKASIFFDFGTNGLDKTYYFDDVEFDGTVLSTSIDPVQRWSVYPNPANHYWTIEAENEVITSLEVHDLQGRKIIALRPNSQKAIVDASSLVSGIYISRVATNSGISTMRLVKE